MDGTWTNVLPSTTVLNLVNSGVFNLDANTSSQTIAGLSGDATGQLGTTNDGSAVVFTINAAGSNTYNGFIGGHHGGRQDRQPTSGSAWSWRAAARQTLTNGTSNFAGGTTLNAGTLVLGNTSGSALGAGNLTFNGGTLATFAGSAGSLSGSVVAGTGANYITPGGDGSIGMLGDRQRPDAQ